MQHGQSTHAAQYDPSEDIVGDIELLQRLHCSNARGEWSLETVEAHVEDGDLLQQFHLWRKASGEVVIQQDDLVQGLAHLPNATGNASPKVVVRQNQHGHWRLAQVLWDAESEPVVIEEDGVQIFVKELGRHTTLELIESEIQVLEGRQPQNHLWELADEAVVAEVKLPQQLHVAEGGGHATAEAVGVEVEESKMPQEAKLPRQESSNVGMVKIDTGYHSEGRIGWKGSAEDTLVGADIGAVPVGSEVEWVRVDGLFPCLQGNVGFPEPPVLELEA